MAPQCGAGRGSRVRLGEHALEAEQEAVAHLPLRRRSGDARVHLDKRFVERAAARGALAERLGGILALAEERFARPRFRARSGGGYRIGCRD
jgi:hypothetical protein